MTTNQYLLRDSVAFDKRTPDIVGDAGITPGDWVEQFKERAAVTWLRGSEPVIAQRLQGVNPVVVRVRSSARTRLIDSSWRVRLKGRNNLALSIVSLMPDQRDFYIEITCQAGVSSG